MFYKRILILTFLFSLITSIVNAQNNFDLDLKNNRSRLAEIRSEINQLKNQLTNTQKRATSISSQINSVDKELALIAQAKGLLLREQRILERRAQLNKKAIKQTKEKLKSLKTLYADRLNYMYKYGKVKNLTLLLTAESFNQALVRYRYLRLIAEYDEKTITEITLKQQKIENLQKQLAEDIDAKSKVINNKIKQEQTFNNRLTEKNTLLKKLKKDQNYYKNQIQVKLDEQKKLTSLISSLEKTRKQNISKPAPDEFVMIDFDNFNKGKGKLPWPVRGKIVSKFGKQYDPVSKTSVNNSGIEIQSTLGTPVKCVFRGVVRMITYLGGYGNTVIIDHGKGFYTVYSHLGEIYVRKNDIVDTSQIIAQVGDSGSLAGSKLHFEIYGGNQSYNPQSWLRKI